VGRTENPGVGGSISSQPTIHFKQLPVRELPPSALQRIPAQLGDEPLLNRHAARRQDEDSSRIEVNRLAWRAGCKQMAYFIDLFSRGTCERFA